MARLTLLPALELKVIAGLVCAPGVLAVTSTVMMHDALPLSWPSAKSIVLPPFGALRPAPAGAIAQEVDATAGLAMVIAAGSVSVKARSVTGEALPLVIVIVIVDTFPGPMVFGVKTLLIVGWASPAETTKLNAIKTIAARP
jgi:hypothetical protein